MSEQSEQTALVVFTPAAEAPKSESAAPQPAAVKSESLLPKLSRVTILALAMAGAAALGSVVGAMAGAALTQPASPPPQTVTADALKSELDRLFFEIAGLKAAQEAGARASSTQWSRLAERLDRTERAQGTATARPEITGSIVEKQQQRPPVVAGWALRDMYRGRAIIENRYGLFEATPGANIPGLGRVESIKQDNGRWVVVTERGLVVSAR